jgi:hypothetical protein
MMEKNTSFGASAFFYYWILQCYTIYILNFVFLANAVKQRFEKINELLE